MPENILVTGANGQLGMEFRALEKKYPAVHFVFVAKEDLSITDTTSLEKFFSANSFSYCINCAAYTAVDKAESEQELSYQINAQATGNLAAMCKAFSARFIHFSTDYVFNGLGTAPYKESDKTDPVNVYGASKLKGEAFAMLNNNDTMIFRTSWVYSSYGKNFVKTMLRLMSEKERIGVVSDQVGSPTYAADLAEAVMQIISSEKFTPGIYNYSNEGIISWYEFATAIKNSTGSNCLVNAIRTSDYPTPAKRPHYSVLDTQKFKDTFQISIPNWEASLAKCLSVLGVKA
jgi:dTDP-4-dehydrorhamnose reductase